MRKKEYPNWNLQEYQHFRCQKITSQYQEPHEVPLQKWFKKILKIPSVDKDADQLGLSYMACGTQDGTAILEKSLAVFLLS